MLLVELGEVTSPAEVMPAVAHALGVVAQPDEPLRDTVLETLVNMKVVVVLDNCEHLLDTCAELTDLLLNRCPGVRVLATSREALWITGEVSFRVEGLPVPSTDRDLVRHGHLRPDGRAARTADAGLPEVAVTAAFAARGDRLELPAAGP